MLVTFSSSTSSEIVMFAEVARQLLQVVGKECLARGVFTKEQLPDAIEALRRASLAEQETVRANGPQAEEIDDEDAQKTPKIGFAQRAYPLIELMEWARQEGGFVMWRAASNFCAEVSDKDRLRL